MNRKVKFLFDAHFRPILSIGTMSITEVTTPFFLSEEARVLAKSTVEELIRSGQYSLNSDGAMPEAVREFIEMLNAVAEGQAVSAFSRRSELTSRQAAEILGVSEPFMVKLLESGDLPSRKIDSQYRVLLDDVLAFQDDTSKKRLEAVDELVRESQRLNLY